MEKLSSYRKKVWNPLLQLHAQLPLHTRVVRLFPGRLLLGPEPAWEVKKLEAS
jgi:hypothetical protein